MYVEFFLHYVMYFLRKKSQIEWKEDDIVYFVPNCQNDNVLVIFIIKQPYSNYLL